MAKNNVVNNYGSFDVTFKSAKGSVLKDVNGKKYIDFLAGIAVNCVGHNYGPLVKAISRQARKQIHISNYYTSDIGNLYADELLFRTGFEGVFFGNSGAEANEAAIKLARKYGQLNGGSKRKVIVTLEKSFHGRTLATLTATGQDKFHPEDFAPYPDGFKTIKPNDMAELKNAFDDTTCALMIECVQGEGGVNLIDPEWAQKAAELARKAGAIVIADEVQTGMGRTGSLLASEQLQFNPDVVTLAKGIAGGVPMGACLFRGKAAEVFAAGEVAWIMALGALLEDWTVERAKKGLKNLIDLTPQTGRRIINGKEEVIQVDEIKIGDILRILPGESVPVDGEIITGTTSLDQSIMTGESLPIDKEVGDEVFCGTINLYGAIDIKATSLGENSSLQKLIDLVKAADEKQAPTQRIADKWATWLVPVALLIAIAAWLITGNIERGVTVLIVFCPCALILATPTAIMAAIGQATKYGVLIKSGEALETLGSLNTLVFDKTGTLTYGNLEVSDVIPLSEDLTDMDLLKITASCEKLSEHPLARAVVKNAKESNIDIEEPEEFKMYPGKGVECRNSYGHVYAGNSKFLLDNNICVDVDTQLDKLKNEGKAKKN